MRSRFSRMGSATRCCPRSRPRHSRDGRFHQVPVLSGATRDEHRLFVGLFRVLAGQPVTAEQYPELLAEAFGEHADRV
jgi:para-nitrobenzyl esterase